MNLLLAASEVHPVWLVIGILAMRMVVATGAALAAMEPQQAGQAMGVWVSAH